MMLACGGQVRRLTLRFADLRIDAAGLGYRQELAFGTGGAAGQFDLRRGLLHAAGPSFAAYSLMLGIYNLLPVWPLDGGRVLRCALLARLPVVQAEHVSEIVSFASCGVLLLAGLVLTFIKKQASGRLELRCI